MYSYSSDSPPVFQLSASGSQIVLVIYTPVIALDHGMALL